jgi:Ricin-type beta-trefoil lectin domain/Domain of unknown function (DUF4476)
MRKLRGLHAKVVTLALTAGPLLAGRAQAQGEGPRAWRARQEPGMALPSGTGRLRNGARGMCLDVAGWAAQGNHNVLLWECNNDPDQVWSFSASGELGNILTGICLDAAGYEGASGANVDIFRCEGLPDQRWTLVPRAPGLFEIHNQKRGLCLDVNGTAGARGDNVLLWACDGGRDQLWGWEPYAAPPPPPPPAPVYAPPRPVGPPPPEPPPPRQHEGWRRQVRPMDEESFRSLVQAVRAEAFSEGQLAVVERASSRSYFRVGQLKAVLDLLSFSATKLRALELMAPRLVDPENAFAIFDAFTFSADKEQVKQILRRNGY